MSPAAQSLVALRSSSFFRSPPESGCFAPPPARLACSRRSATGFTGLTTNGRKIDGISSGEEHDQSAFKMGGRFVEGWFVYRQTFVIRSYEIGPDKTATMETLMNLLQETALNHVMSSGLADDGFGATREMSSRKLIWVVTRIHILGRCRRKEWNEEGLADQRLCHQRDHCQGY